MNKCRENKYSMYRSVGEVFKKNRELFAGIPALTEAIAGFERIFTEITEIDKKYLSVAKGAAQDKYNAQDELIESLVKIGGVLYISGKKGKNENLKAISTLSYSGLKKMRDNDFLTKSKTVLQNAAANRESLKNLHTDIENEIKLLETRIVNYENSMNSKESKNLESHASKEALDLAFDTADEILIDELDNLIEFIREKDIDIYNQYRSARMIKKTGTRKKKKEEVTGDALSEKKEAASATEMKK